MSKALLWRRYKLSWRFCQSTMSICTSALRDHYHLIKDRTKETFLFSFRFFASLEPIECGITSNRYISIYFTWIFFEIEKVKKVYPKRSCRDYQKFEKNWSDYLIFVEFIPDKKNSIWIPMPIHPIILCIVKFFLEQSEYENIVNLLRWS